MLLALIPAFEMGLYQLTLAIEKAGLTLWDTFGIYGSKEGNSD